MKYCQGTRCHTYKTKDRIRGHKGDKHYETRKRSSFSYGKSNFCSLNCQNDWFYKFGDMAIDHFGRIHEPKRTDCDQAWYKDCKYLGWNDSNTDTRYAHYFVNDLLGERIPISEREYQDDNYKSPIRE